MRSEFYSKSTKLYISKKPLKIDGRVKKAAETANIVLDWDDEGRINFIDFDGARKLLGALGSKMMSPVEYWRVLADARNAGDEETVKELTSDEYCEWLDRVYLKEGKYIDHPKIVSKNVYAGKKYASRFPLGVPGWFNPERNIDYSTGLPKVVECFREKFATSWKYWSPVFSARGFNVTAVLRSYVTSIGKPSFDIGLPTDSRQPMQVVRECRTVPLEPVVKKEIVNAAHDLLASYSKIASGLRSRKNYDEFYKKAQKHIDFLKKYGALFRKSREFTVYGIREKMFNALGLLKVIAITKKDYKRAEKIDGVSKKLASVGGGRLEYGTFLKFVKNSKRLLKNAIESKTDIVFVMGHKNPDSDTVVSSLFEAWRNQLMSEDIAYIPVIQNYKVPDEARHLLGREIADEVLLTADNDYIQAKKSGLARWISVDQNKDAEAQKYFISIIDHHPLCETAKAQELPLTFELVGSCSSLIAQKMMGMGIYFDARLARLLYGAMLMDTENRVRHKMTVKDALIMDYLRDASNTPNDSDFYRELMSFLLDTNDPDVLFGRDYKEDWGFGFAVAKVKNCFKDNGRTIKKRLIGRALLLAKENNVNKNLPLTLLRITDYKEDNETVNRERVYLVFNKLASKEFKRTVLDLLADIVRFEFGETRLIKASGYVEFWGTGMQLSRKKTAPILEPAVKAFNEYFYAPTVRLWVKRDFLRKTRDAVLATRRAGLKANADKRGRINYITYPEAKALARELGFRMLSIKEYWSVLDYAKKIKDIQMIESLQGSNFVEFWDTVIKQNKCLIDHPLIEKIGKDYHFHGKSRIVAVPKGSPGLVHPDEIDRQTGLPKTVRMPNEYGNPELWRYWAPDAETVIPVRSYIFLLKQPCWDGKFHSRDSFPKLGIRPCYREVEQPRARITRSARRLRMKIEKEGESVSYSWAK